MRRNYHRILLVLILILFAFASWGIYLAIIFFMQPDTVIINLQEGLSRLEIAKTIRHEMRWSKKEANEFSSVFAQMQWAEFNEEVLDIFTKRFGWPLAEREIFLTRSSIYVDPQYDFFSTVYEPGTYIFSRSLTKAQMAGFLIERIKDTAGSGLKTFLTKNLHEESVIAVASLVQQKVELLPDLVPLPAEDISVKQEDGKTLLSFSTTYYNQGEGALELRADSKTQGIRADIERQVFQYIYRTDGGHREKLVGTFLWHQPHLHYHFADFIVYDLEVVNVRGQEHDLSGIRSKSTFCIRDVSRVSIELENRVPDALYKICKKEIQGISVGWGDTYFYNYPDQSLNITDLPSGTYRLNFIVNPDNNFEEMDYSNNTSSVVFKFDMKKLTIKIIEKNPAETPIVEHVYQEQENCANCTL